MMRLIIAHKYSISRKRRYFNEMIDGRMNTRTSLLNILFNFGTNVAMSRKQSLILTAG